MKLWRGVGFYQSSDDDGDISITADELIVEDDDPIDTGLVDQHGTTIYRCVEKLPIGFHI